MAAPGDFRRFNELTEGINDKRLFKALFVIGIAGAGKSTISSPLSFFAKRIDVDIPQEYFSYARKIGLGKDDPYEGKQLIRKIGKQVIYSELFHYTNGMLPLVINTTGDDLDHTNLRIMILRSLGYDVGMVYVKTELAQSIKRVTARRYHQDYHRFIPPEHITSSYTKLLKNTRAYQNHLGIRAKNSKKLLDFYAEVDNTDGIGELDKKFIDKEVQRFFDGPIKNPTGQRTLQKLRLEPGKKVISDLYGRSYVEEYLADWFQ